MGRDGLTVENATFESPTIFYGSRIKGTVEGRGAQFREDVHFGRVLATYSIRFADSAVFDKSATFTNSQIKGSTGSLYIRNATFNGPFYCRKVTVPKINCNDSVFRARAVFSGSQIGGSFKAVNANFHGALLLGDGDTQNHPEKTEIEGETSFKNAIAGQYVGMEKVQFRESLDLSSVDFRDQVMLLYPSLENDVNLSGATFSRELTIKPLNCRTPTDEPLEVNINGATIRSGTLTQPGREDCPSIRYEFVDATVGDVTFLDATLDGKPYLESNYTYELSSLQNVRFERTRFDGFDFTAYRSSLEGHWSLHGYDSSVTTVVPYLNSVNRPLRQIAGFTGGTIERLLGRPREPENYSISPPDIPMNKAQLGDSDSLERTYRRAKHGATEIGDNRAAAEFFVHEMDARREQYRRREEDANRLPERFYYKIGRIGLDLWSLVRYSENPFLVMGYSVLAILSFGILDSLVGILGGAPTPYPRLPLNLGYFIVSSESLISLVYPPGATITFLPLRILTIVEGFFGAFLIALFVFALTRAVHR